MPRSGCPGSVQLAQGPCVADKDCANFCDGFRFDPRRGPAADLTKKQAAKDAFGSLFKD